AQSPGEDLVAAAVRVVAQDRRAPLVVLVADIAGGADGQVQLVVWPKGNRARRVPAEREIGNDHLTLADRPIRVVGEARDLAGLPNVQVEDAINLVERDVGG